MTEPISCFLVLSALFGEWMRRRKSFESRTKKVQKKASIYSRGVSSVLFRGALSLFGRGAQSKQRGTNPLGTANRRPHGPEGRHGVWGIQV